MASFGAANGVVAGSRAALQHVKDVQASSEKEAWRTHRDGVAVKQKNWSWCTGTSQAGNLRCTCCCGTTIAPSAHALNVSRK
jgi:hypothetical protein